MRREGVTFSGNGQRSLITLGCTHKGSIPSVTPRFDHLAIDRPNRKMNNGEKIIGGDLLWRPTEASKNTIFERFLPKIGLWRKVAYAN